MKSLLESWNKFLNEEDRSSADATNVVDFPTKSLNKDLDFYLTANQAKTLQDIVSKFNGSLEGLLEPLSLKMVAEGDVIPLPRAKKIREALPRYEPRRI